MRDRLSRVLFRAVLGGMLATLAIAAVASGGASDVIRADPVMNEFSQASYDSSQGQVLTFTNGSVDGTKHNVIATQVGPDRQNLFRSATIGPGSTPVKGTQYLGPGTYPFVCTLHAGMDARLVIGSGGVRVQRPKINLTIPGQTLNQVLNRGFVRVRVKALTRSAQIVVTASSGRVTVGTKRIASLAAGVSRVLSIPLSRASRAKFQNAEQAPLSGRGTVPFGRADSARRGLT